jgi:TRAP-type C4-dicarboxylate transport system permease small subunit
MVPMRTPARVLGLALAFVATFFAGSAGAFAAEPTGGAWPEGPDRSHLYLLVLFGGGTLGLFVVITLFALLTARNNYVPPAPGKEIHRASDATPARHH